MRHRARAIVTGTAALALAGSLSACTGETELTQAEQSRVPTEELVGQTMTMTHEVQDVLSDTMFTVGEEATVIIADDLPDQLTSGDEVEITGTVERQDVFDVEDIDSLRNTTDDETAQYLMDRGVELVLTDATVTPVD